MHPYFIDIPNHWEKKRFKYVFDYQKGRNPKENDLLLEAENDYLQYLSMDVLRNNPKVIFYVKDTTNCILVKEEDILLLWDGSNAGEFILGKNGILSSTMAVMKPKTNIHKNYSWFLLKNLELSLRSQTLGMGIPHVNTDFLENFLLFLPPLPEQEKIANFLDEKTTQIDSLITKKTELIALLQEEEKAFINEKLTTNTENWQKKKLHMIANVVLGKMLCNEDKGNYSLKPYLKAKNIDWLKPNVDSVEEMWFSEHEINIYRVRKNDLLVCEGGDVGRTCIWGNEIEECYIQNSVHKITFNEQCNPYFYLYFFYLLGATNFFKSIVNQVSIAHLTREKLVKIQVPFPDLIIQNQIVSEIEAHIEKSRAIAEKLEKEVSLLKEYRQSLISEAVTGKLSI